MKHCPRLTPNSCLSRPSSLPSLAAGVTVAWLCCLSACSSSTPTASGGHSSSTTGENPASGGGAPDASADSSTEAPTQVSVTIDVSAPKEISPYLFGINYWNWVPAWGAQVFAVKDLVTTMHVGLLRAGGTYPDISQPVPFDETQIDKFVGYAKDVGAAPYFQIPFVSMWDSAGNLTSSTKEGAAKLVEYMNVTHDYQVKFFSIGNEPDIYESQQRIIAGQSTAGYTPEAFCASFAAYATAMKAVDPSIRVLGPELSWKYWDGNDWLTPFLEKCADQVDVVTVHRYPFNSTQDTASAVLADASSFRAVIQMLRQKMQKAGVGTKPLAITEAAVTWDDDPAKTQLSGAPGTLPSGLWVADSFGVAMEEQLFSLDVWGISESWTLGYIDGRTPKPEYYAFSTVAKHFRSKIAATTGSTSQLAVYGGRNETSTPVLLVNRSTSAFTVSIAVQGASAKVPDASVAVAPFSATVVEIADDGSAPVVDVALPHTP